MAKVPINFEITREDEPTTHLFKIKFGTDQGILAMDLATAIGNELGKAGITIEIKPGSENIIIETTENLDAARANPIIQNVLARLENDTFTDSSTPLYANLKTQGVTATYRDISATIEEHSPEDNTPLSGSAAVTISDVDPTLRKTPSRRRLPSGEEGGEESDIEGGDEGTEHDDPHNAARRNPRPITPAAQQQAGVRIHRTESTDSETDPDPTHPPVVPTPPTTTPSTPTTIPAYPYAHGSAVLRAITAARAGHMGDFYEGPESFTTWSQHTTMMSDVKNDFLPSLANFVAEANDLVSMVTADPAQGAQILDRAVGALDDERNKGKSVEQILESIDPNLLKTLDSKFRESQHGIGYTTPIAANISAAYESNTNPLARMNDFGLTDARRQKLIALFEASILFAGTKFEHKPDGSFTLYANVNGVMTPILEGTMNSTSYSITTVKGMPASEYARADIAASYITMQFRQKNNNNSAKMKMKPNADPLRVMIRASELICRGKMRIDLTEVSPYVIAKINNGNYPHKQELLKAWNELLYASTMRSHRNPDVIENWPHALIKDFDLRSMLSPHQSIDTALTRLGSRVEKLTSTPQPALAASAGAPSPTPPALPPIPGGAPPALPSTSRPRLGST